MPTPYMWARMVIPAHMVEALEAWRDVGQVPGHFLSAVISNDLAEAVARADDLNQPILAAYVTWLYNEAPASCWGSPEKMEEWTGRIPV